jgi:hypothetical protein
VKVLASAFAVAALGVAFVLPAGAQTNSTISGKLVDLVTYVTRDHNMSAMKGDHAMAGGDHAMAGGDHAMAGGDHAMAGGDHAMAGGDHAMAGGDHAMAGGDHAMAGGDHAMAGGDHAMAGGDHASCPSLGVVSSKGKVIMVSAQQGSATAKDLCAKLNANVTLTGTYYSQGGTSVFLVTSAN